MRKNIVLKLKVKTIAALNNANPFSLTFGNEPTNFIDRPQEKGKFCVSFRLMSLLVRFAY